MARTGRPSKLLAALHHRLVSPHVPLARPSAHRLSFLSPRSPTSSSSADDPIRDVDATGQGRADAEHRSTGRKGPAATSHCSASTCTPTRASLPLRQKAPVSGLPAEWSGTDQAGHGHLASILKSRLCHQRSSAMAFRPGDPKPDWNGERSPAR